MTSTALIGARVLADGTWLDDHAVVIASGRVSAIVPSDQVPPDVHREALDGGLLLPGFIDTQVNGGGGVLFNDDPTVDGIRTIGAAHRAFGTTSFLPTLISDDLSVVARAITAVDEAIAAGVPGVRGIHIEGPFLNEGKRGIHDATKFKRLDEGAITLLTSLKRGKTLITLAPELAPPGGIAALVAGGAIVAAGHSLATYDDISRAVDEGLTGVTHLFNAMSQMEGRTPGVVGAALSRDLTCGIIVDGHHVHPASLRAAFAAKGAERLMLVTDAMSTVGSALTSFSLGGVKIIAKDGALRSADGTLAGSTLDMATAVRGAVSMMSVDLATACQMASATPAAFLGLSAERGAISAGQFADLVHLSDDTRVAATWIEGIRS
jgi:N-acetylglucosamine-6-phosphate deacetylase